MNQLAKEISAEVTELISRYGFDLDGYSVNALVDYWMQQYPAFWIRLATIEALYQGRYKAISIEQILNLWRRRTRPVYHFNGEFERMISLRPMLSAATPTRPASPDKPAAPAANVPSNTAQVDPTERETASHGSEFFQIETQNTFAPKQHDPFPAEVDPASWYSSPNVTQGNFALSSTDSEEIRKATAIEPPPIDQFTPKLEVSDFYWRLKAVMQAMGTGTVEEIGRRN